MFKNLFTGKQARTKADNWLFGTMLVFGVAGLIASFVLTLEKFHLLADPDAVLSCSFNIVLNCSTVMQTWQSSLFGFPNMLIGMMAFPVVITVAVAGLSGVRFPRAFMNAATICYGLGAIFAYWLFFQSLYAIQVLCPWCLIVTFSTTILLATIVHYNLRENYLGLSKKAHRQVTTFLSKGYGQLITACWLVLMVVLVITKFQDALFL